MIPGKNIFRYYYDSALKVIKDFKRYKAMFLQWQNNIKQVW